MGWFSYDERDLNKDLNDIDNAFNKAKKEMREIDQSIKQAKLDHATAKKAWSYNVDDLADAFERVRKEADRILDHLPKTSSASGAETKAAQLSAVAESASKYAREISDMEPYILRHWGLYTAAIAGAATTLVSSALLEKAAIAAGKTAAAAFSVGLKTFLGFGAILVVGGMIVGRVHDWHRSEVAGKFKDPLDAADPEDQAEVRAAERKLSEAEKEAKALDRVLEDLGKKKKKKKLLDASFSRTEALHAELVAQVKRINWGD